MIPLFGASDVLRLVTSSTAPVDVVAAFARRDGAGNIAPDRLPTGITSATTTTIVAAGGAGVMTTIRFLSIRNKHATTANTVTIELFNGTSAFEIYEVTLAAGEQFLYDEANGYQYLNAQGLPKTAQSQGSSAAAVTATNIVVLSADVTNNNAVANTLQDVTGLSFPVIAGETYWFEFFIDYTAAVTSTGARFTVSGPSFSRLAYAANFPSSATAFAFVAAATYDQGVVTTASPTTTGNLAYVAGLITPSVDGNVIARFASEIASSAIVAKRGSVCRWMRTF